jgi:hypothetical protein
LQIKPRVVLVETFAIHDVDVEVKTVSLDLNRLGEHLDDVD